MRAIDIEWDTGGDQEILDSLPKEVRIPPDVARDGIEDYLSDEYGYCHFGYRVVPDGHIRETNVDAAWFLPEDVRWRAFTLDSPADLADVCRVLYGDCRMDRIESMSGARYPAVAIFAVSDDPDWGRCLGTGAMIMLRWSAMMSALEKGAAHA